MPKLKISIVTVVYNAQSTLADTIRSVAEQDYPDVEYIVVDGGSSDQSVAIINQHADIIDAWVSEPDQGIYDAMNKGISMANGDVIGFLNADDVYAHERVLSEVAAVLCNEQTDACFADLLYVEQHDISKVVRYWKSETFRVSKQFLAGWVPPHPTFFVKKKVYQRAGVFDLSYKLAADFELMARFFLNYGIQATYTPGVWVRMRLGGATNRHWLNVIRQNKEISQALRHYGLRPGGGFLLRKAWVRLCQFWHGATR